MWQRPGARRSSMHSARRLRRRDLPRREGAHRSAPQAEPLEGRLLLSGMVEYPLASAGSSPVAIAQGPGGQMWFIDQGSNRIGSIDPVTHAIQTYPIPTSSAYPSSLTEGPDGNLWFTEERVGQIGVLDPSTGTIKEIPTPTENSEPYGITVGPDGNLWFTELTSNRIGRLTPGILVAGGASPAAATPAGSRSPSVGLPAPPVAAAVDPLLLGPAPAATPPAAGSPAAWAPDGALRWIGTSGRLAAHGATGAAARDRVFAEFGEAVPDEAVASVPAWLGGRAQ
jgi:hypothetical protein